MNGIGIGLKVIAATLALGASAPQATAVSGSAVSRCHTRSLTAVLVKDGAGLGHSFYKIGLRNTSERTCWVKGYPGVSFLGARRHQIGRSAKRVPRRVRRVTVKPREAAVAKLDVATGACKRVRRSRYLRVIPPDETRSLVIRARVVVCRSTVYPLR